MTDTTKPAPPAAPTTPSLEQAMAELQQASANLHSRVGPESGEFVPEQAAITDRPQQPTALTESGAGYAQHAPIGHIHAPLWGMAVMATSILYEQNIPGITDNPNLSGMLRVCKVCFSLYFEPRDGEGNVIPYDQLPQAASFVTQPVRAVPTQPAPPGRGWQPAPRRGGWR